MWEPHGLVYSGRLSRADTAALAAVVPEAAREGDRSARRILREAGTELGLSAAVVARRLGMQRRKTTVGMVGGVFRMSADVRSSFRHKVRGSVPKAVFAVPLFSPAVGSVLLALRLAGIRTTRKIMANLEAASQRIGDK
jgi:N-acetylglucosamine kinase-like BadF-type ATPase